MPVIDAPVLARGADSLPFSEGGTAAQALALKAAGFDFFIGYLGAMNEERLDGVIAAGLGFMPVTFGGPNAFNGAGTVAQCETLGLPADISVWLDLEGPEVAAMDAPTLIGKINGWADVVASHGFLPCLYVGVPQPLTSEELYALHVVRYWRGQGSIRDRHNALAEPTGCGWCMTQAYPSVVRGCVLIDGSMVGHDYKGRAPRMMIA